MTDARPKRLCDSCAALDDHPRHVIAVVPGENVPTTEFIAKALAGVNVEDNPLVVAELLDTSTRMKHMDCCRADGCPDGACNEVTAGAENLRGAKLVKHLTSREA